MLELGARLERIEALLGPAICGECYEVPADMAEDVDKHLPGSKATSRRGTPSLDLRAGLWEQLAAAGVGRIGVDPRCTMEDETLFSHRRQGTTGRQAAVTWLEQEWRSSRSGTPNWRARCSACASASRPPWPPRGASRAASSCSR